MDQAQRPDQGNKRQTPPEVEWNGTRGTLAKLRQDAARKGISITIDTNIPFGPPFPTDNISLNNGLKNYSNALEKHRFEVAERWLPSMGVTLEVDGRASINYRGGAAVTETYIDREIAQRVREDAAYFDIMCGVASLMLEQGICRMEVPETQRGGRRRNEMDRLLLNHIGLSRREDVRLLAELLMIDLDLMRRQEEATAKFYELDPLVEGKYKPSSFSSMQFKRNDRPADQVAKRIGIDLELVREFRDRARYAICIGADGAPFNPYAWLRDGVQVDWKPVA